MRNDNFRGRETAGREYHREVEESKTDVVWKKAYGDGTTSKKKKRKTEAEVDGLCQPSHDSHRNQKR